MSNSVKVTQESGVVDPPIDIRNLDDEYHLAPSSRLAQGRNLVRNGTITAPSRLAVPYHAGGISINQRTNLTRISERIVAIEASIVALRTSVTELRSEMKQGFTEVMARLRVLEQEKKTVRE